MDQPLHNVTLQDINKIANGVIDISATGYDALNLQQQMWVDYNVLQGVIVGSDGEMSKLSITDFAKQLEVERMTLYRWSKSIPDFWDIVNSRRKDIFKGARTAKVYNALFIAATVKLNPQAIAMWLANSGTDFRMPTQPIEHEVGGGLADLMQKVRQRQLAEVQNVNSTDNT